MDRMTSILTVAVKTWKKNISNIEIGDYEAINKRNSAFFYSLYFVGNFHLIVIIIIFNTPFVLPLEMNSFGIIATYLSA